MPSTERENHCTIEEELSANVAITVGTGVWEVNLCLFIIDGLLVQPIAERTYLYWHLNGAQVVKSLA